MFKTTRWAAALAAALLSACGGGGGTGTIVPQASPAVPGAPLSTTETDMQLRPVPANAPPVKISEFYDPAVPASGGVTSTRDGTVWFTALSSAQTPEIVEMRGRDDRVVNVPPLPSATNGMNVATDLIATPNGRVWDDVATFGSSDGPGGQPLQDDRFVFAVNGASVTQPPDGIDTGDAGMAGVAGVTTDTQGNLWFSAPSSIFYPGSEFGSIGESAADADGVTRYFVDPTLTGAIAVMPNGEIWIAGLFALPSYQLSIGRYTRNGTLLGTLDAPSSYLNVRDAVVGADGAYWYTDGTSISRTGVDGTTSTYIVPSRDPDIEGMALGSDGAVWFTESATSKIGRITTNGTVTEYPLPSSNASPMEIVGPKSSGCGYGELWVAEAGTGKIARLTIAP